MGSKTSTRWKGHKPKLTVDDCYALTVEGLDSLGLLGENLPSTGSFTWHHRLGTATTLHYSASIALMNNCRYHQFFFVAPVNQWVYVERKPYKVGGDKWLIVCPNQGCRRRVNAVYRPTEQDKFACRRCLSLGYASNRKIKSEPRYLFAQRPSINQQGYDKRWADRL